MFPIRNNEGATCWPLSQPVAFRSVLRPTAPNRFQPTERGSIGLPLRAFSQFGSFVLAGPFGPGLDASLTRGLICSRRVALSMRAPTLTGKPFRALERVELFPLRFYRRMPDLCDGRPRTFRC